MLTRGIDISDISSLGGAAHLSSDLFDEPGRSTPPVPPGLEGLGQSLPLDLDDDEDVPRRSTPTIPPGFTAPVIAPIKDDSASLPPSRSSSRASLRRGNSQILPVVPVLPGTPIRAPTPLRHESKPIVGSIGDFSTPTKRGRSESHLANVEYAEAKDASAGAEAETPKTETKESKAEAKKAKRKEKLEKKEAERAEKAAAAAQKKAAKEAEKPSSPLDDSEIQPAPPGASKEEKNMAATKTSDLVKDLTPAEAAAAAKSSAGETVSKKKHPGKIDITAALLKGADVPLPTTSSWTPVKTENIPRGATWGSTAASSRPQSPSVPSDVGGKKTTAPRTLRLTTAPVPPPAPVVAPAVRPILNAASRMPSRQPSIASINPPGTPSSEHISDDVSMTSTSLSRANTPPPSASNRVGSAPVRHNTKSQQRKARQEKAKQIEEEERLAKEAAEIKAEPIQEAITSRKKKSKKSSTPALSSTPAPSRPASPKPKAVKAEEPVVKVEPKPATPVKVETPPPPPPAPATPVIEAAPVSSAQPLPPPPPPPAALTPASLIAELRGEHGTLTGAFDAFFRPIAQAIAHYKPSTPITPADVSPGRAFPLLDPDLKKEDIEALVSGQAWRPSAEDQRLWERLMVSPTGAVIRHMEPSLEDRFLAMEALNAALPEPLRFHPPTPRSGSGTTFPSLDLAALHRELDGFPSRTANAMEKAVEEGSKKGSFLVDTAGKYVNEFIMPPVAVTPPNERAVEEQRDGVLGAEELERRLTEAKRVAEEREQGLRRLVKRNRKVVGMTH